VHRGARVVSVAENYDLLGYAADAVTRDTRYTRYVSDRKMLRSHTSALVPGALRALADSDRVGDLGVGLGVGDVLVVCPGAVVRDLSIAVAEDDDAEQIGDRVRDALGDDAAAVESVDVVSETPGDALPSAARERLGLASEQKNLLVRVVLRHPERSLTRTEA